MKSISDHGFKKGVKNIQSQFGALLVTKGTKDKQDGVIFFINSMFVGSSNLFTCLIKCCNVARCQSERKQKQNFVTRNQKYICDTFPDLSQLCFSPFCRGQERASPTFFFHASPEAFVEPAETTLVPLILIHNALPAEPEQIQRTITWEKRGLEKKKVHCIIMQFKMLCCKNQQCWICAHDQKVVHVHPTHWYVGFRRLYLQV